MSVTNVTNSSSTSASSSSTSTTGGTQTTPIDQQTFLKLLMAQLQNQDPLNPTDSTQFVTQLSQFSLVEQAVNQTNQLTTVSQQLSGLSNSDAANLIGKTVTISNGGGTVNYDGVTAVSSNVTLASPAASVTATVTDASGNVVRTIKLGSEGAGPLNISWNGKGDSGQSEPSGSYNIAVSATAQDGSSVSVSQYTTGVVNQVSYSQGYAQLILAGGASAPLSNLVSVAGTTTTNNQ